MVKFLTMRSHGERDSGQWCKEPLHTSCSKTEKTQDCTPKLIAYRCINKNGNYLKVEVLEPSNRL